MGTRKCPIERFVGHPVEKVNDLDAGDGRFDQLGPGYPAGANRIDQRNRVEVTERVVAECVHMLHSRDASRLGLTDLKPDESSHGHAGVVEQRLDGLLLSDTDGCSSSTTS